MGKKFCPNCGSEDVEMMAGGITGSYECMDCGNHGSLFPEKELIGEAVELGEDEEEKEEIMRRTSKLDTKFKVKKSVKKAKSKVKKVGKKKGGKKRK